MEEGGIMSYLGEKDIKALTISAICIFALCISMVISFHLNQLDDYAAQFFAAFMSFFEVIFCMLGVGILFCRSIHMLLEKHRR